MVTTHANFGATFRGSFPGSARNPKSVGVTGQSDKKISKFGLNISRKTLEKDSEYHEISKNWSLVLLEFQWLHSALAVVFFLSGKIVKRKATGVQRKATSEAKIK